MHPAERGYLEVDWLGWNVEWEPNDSWVATGQNPDGFQLDDRGVETLLHGFLFHQIGGQALLVAITEDRHHHRVAIEHSKIIPMVDLDTRLLQCYACRHQATPKLSLYRRAR